MYGSRASRMRQRWEFHTQHYHDIYIVGDVDKLHCIINHKHEHHNGGNTFRGTRSRA